MQLCNRCILLTYYGTNENTVTSVDDIECIFCITLAIMKLLPLFGRLWLPCLISTKFVLMKNVEFFIRIITHGWLLSMMGHYPAI